MMDCVQNIHQKYCFMSSYTKFRLRFDGTLFAVTNCFTRLSVGLKCVCVCVGLSVHLEFPEQQQFVCHLQII